VIELLDAVLGAPAGSPGTRAQTPVSELFSSLLDQQTEPVEAEVAAQDPTLVLRPELVVDPAQVPVASGLPRGPLEVAPPQEGEPLPSSGAVDVEVLRLPPEVVDPGPTPPPTDLEPQSATTRPGAPAVTSLRLHPVQGKVDGSSPLQQGLESVEAVSGRSEPAVVDGDLPAIRLVDAPARTPLAPQEPLQLRVAQGGDPGLMDGGESGGEPTPEKAREILLEAPELSFERLVVPPPGPRAVRVDVDSELSVEVHLDDADVDVTVEASADTLDGLGELDEELGDDLARHGFTLRDYDARRRPGSRPDPRPTNKASAPSILARSAQARTLRRGRLMNAVA